MGSRVGLCVGCREYYGVTWSCLTSWPDQVAPAQAQPAVSRAQLASIMPRRQGGVATGRASTTHASLQPASPTGPTCNTTACSGLGVLIKLVK